MWDNIQHLASCILCDLCRYEIRENSFVQAYAYLVADVRSRIRADNLDERAARHPTKVHKLLIFDTSMS